MVSHGPSSSSQRETTATAITGCWSRRWHACAGAGRRRGSSSSPISPFRFRLDMGSRHPSLGHTEMRELYGHASVVALAVKPNLHISGLSVLLEAMACRRPVVMTETPGLSEYIRHGETGILVPPGDAEALASAVEALLADPQRAAEIGAAGHAAVSRFSTSAQATLLDEIIRGSL